MPRKPRVQFPGAIYHVITRGDGRRELFHDQGHYQRFSEGLAFVDVASVAAMFPILRSLDQWFLANARVQMDIPTECPEIGIVFNLESLESSLVEVS